MATAPRSDIENQSDETFQLSCSPCKHKGRNKEADKYCVDCNDYYCSECVKCHEDIPAMSTHKIVDKGQGQSGGGLPVAPTERCERHRFKPVDMYCENHDDVGCSTCMAVDHRMCKDIFDVPEFVKTKKLQAHSKTIRDDLTMEKENLRKLLDTCLLRRDCLLNSKKEALLKLIEFRREIEMKLDQLEQKSIAEIERKCNMLSEKLNEIIQSVQHAQKEIKHADNKMVLSGCNVSQFFVSSKIWKRAVETAVRIRQEITSETLDIEIEFKQNDEFLTCLNTFDDLCWIRQSNDLYKVRKKKTFNIEHQSDKNDCSIYSICVLDDGSTILADYKNKKLKRIDSKFANIDICELTESPYQICSVDKHDVAAIGNDGKTIYFVSFLKEPSKTKEIQTDHGCYGIMFKKGFLYAADSYTSVFVYNMNGTKLKQLTRDQNGQPLFKDIYSMTVSTDGSRIYVADNKLGIVVMDENGTLQGKYDCDELKGVTRICTADNGNIFASGYQNNCILQFNKHGKKLGNILSSDTETKRCRAIMFNHKKNQLIVGREDKIYIHELS